VVLARDVLLDEVDLGSEVVVIGGGAVGCEVALHIAHQGTIDPETARFLIINEGESLETVRDLLMFGNKRVTLIEMLDKVGSDIGKSTRWTIRQDLNTRGISQIANATVLRIKPEGVVYLFGEKEEVIQAESIVLALGSRQEGQLSEDLKDKVSEIYLVGDAKEPRKALDAVHEGFRAGWNL